MTSYRFLPWVRAGAAGALADPDDLLRAGPVRGGLALAATVAPGGLTAAPPVRLYGPGDVTALDERQVVRRHPAPGTADAETTVFPMVEFDRPDLPWMFTPLATGPTGRVRPWLALVCVPAPLHLRYEPGRPLPVLRAPTSELPHPAASHLWAHAQVVAGSDAEMAAALGPGGDQRRTLSRLIAPRLLARSTSYLACVVPTFEAGRRAGLGEPGGDLTPAWTTGECELPVLLSWEFRTGEGGDFETLADRLRTWAPGPGDGPGGRAMRVSGTTVTVAVPGALRPAGGPPPALWPSDTASAAWRAGLLDRLTPAPPAPDDPDPEVVPPLYGGFHALRDRVDPAGTGWFDTLNADPRWRVAAGLGARVVQRHQEELMAAAWQQLADRRAANRFLELARLARLVGGSLHRRHVTPLTASEVLEVAVPLQARAPRGEVTLHGEVVDSLLPDGVATLPFHRATSPRGRLSRRVGGQAPFGDVAERLAGAPGGLRAAPRDPDGTVTFRAPPEDVVAPERLPEVRAPLGGRDWDAANAEADAAARARDVPPGTIATAPPPSPEILDEALRLGSTPDVEPDDGFLDEAVLQPDGTIRLPDGTVLPGSVLPGLAGTGPDRVAALFALVRALLAAAAAEQAAGRAAEALALTARAVELLRELATDDAVRFGPELTAGLQALSLRGWQALRPVLEFTAPGDEAADRLVAAAEAIPAANPAHAAALLDAVRWIDDLAGLQANRSDAAAAAGTTGRAVALWRRLEALAPDPHRRGLAAALARLANYQAVAPAPVPAVLEAIDEAVGIWTALGTAMDRAAAAFQLFDISNHLVNRAQQDVGPTDAERAQIRAEAIARDVRAVELYRGLNAADPIEFGPWLAEALVRLGSHRNTAGGPVDGIRAAYLEAVEVLLGFAALLPPDDDRRGPARATAVVRLRELAALLDNHQGPSAESAALRERAAALEAGPDA